MTETDQDREARLPGEGRPITDRFWKTLSGTIKSVGSDERLRTAVNAMVGEESVRSIIQSLLPKDAAQSLKGSLDVFLENLKVELLSFLSARADQLIQDFDAREEFTRFLAEHQIEIHATISVGGKREESKDSSPATKISLRTKGPEPAPKKKAPRKKKAAQTAKPKGNPSGTQQTEPKQKPTKKRKPANPRSSAPAAKKRRAKKTKASPKG